jgi:lysosomal acid lipase/cholesteryl ester hydrolase
MVHGLTHTGHTFLINQGTKPPALVLVDEGYDVWLGSTRGNHYSRKHKTLDPSDPAFWDWTSIDIARHDLPAMIRYVKAETGRPKISYIGHS